MIGTLRQDCLDHVIVRNENHLEHVLDGYLNYYRGRPHRGLRMQPPDGERHLPPPRPPREARIVTTPILGDLHHRYAFVGFPPGVRAPPGAPAAVAMATD